MKVEVKVKGDLETTMRVDGMDMDMEMVKLGWLPYNCIHARKHAAPGQGAWTWVVVEGFWKAFNGLAS